MESTNAIYGRESVCVEKGKRIGRNRGIGNQFKIQALGGVVGTANATGLGALLIFLALPVQGSVGAAAPAPLQGFK